MVVPVQTAELFESTIATVEESTYWVEGTSLLSSLSPVTIAETLVSKPLTG